MSRKHPFTALFLVAIVTSLLSLSSPVQALPGTISRNSIVMRVSPTYIATQVRDGDYIGPITVSNTGPVPLDLEGVVHEGGHDENGIPVFPASMSNASANGVLLTLEPTEFRLMPGESRSIKVRAHVSRGFSGGAYPIILLQGKPAGGKQAEEIHARSQVGVLTLITVAAGRKQEQICASTDITSIVLSQDPVDKSITVSAICENQGNIHTTLSGTAIIRDCLGQPASLTQLTSAVCLPGYKRIITGRFEPGNLKKGIYVAEVLVNAGASSLPSIPVAFQVTDIGVLSLNYDSKTHAPSDT